MSTNTDPESTSSRNVTLSYIILHGAGEIPISTSRLQSVPSNLRIMSNGAYQISSDELIQFGDREPDLCKMFKDMYKERIKKRFLMMRKSTIFELEPLSLRSLSLKNGRQVKTDIDTFLLKIAVEITELGVFVFHVFLAPSINVTPIDCIDFRDPSQVFVEVDVQLQLSTQVRLFGNYSILDITRFYFICIVSSLFEEKRFARRVLSSFGGSHSISEIENKLMSYLSKNFRPFQEIDFFPLFFFSLNTDRKGLQDFIDKSKKVLRALMTQDRNWDKKTDEIVSSIITKRNFASRDSLAWFVHDMGSVKLYSTDFETPIPNSKLLTHFELGIVLTMKYYLYRTIFRLQEALESNWTPRKLSNFRRDEFEKLQNYYNLDIVCKDTTAYRFEKFIEIFNVDDALSNVQDRFRYLGESLSTKYQQHLSRTQMLLTLIFGAFGAAMLGYSVLSRMSDPTVDKGTFTWEILLTSILTISVLVLLVGIIKLIRKL